MNIEMNEQSKLRKWFVRKTDFIQKVFPPVSFVSVRIRIIANYIDIFIFIFVMNERSK